MQAVTSSASGARVYAITGNRVFKSNNYGANWTEIFQFTFLNGSSVSKLNTAWKSIATDSTGNIIYAIKNNGLWKSNDTHKFRQLLASEILYSVTTNGNGSKVLVGSKNSTWESFNGGNSFLKISVAGYSYAMSCDGAPMYAASRDGPMWKSNGFAWGIFESSQGWGSIACDKRCNTIIALDRKGTLWKSSSINQVVLLRVSGSHSCAILDSGKFKCWGNSPYGELGYGDTKNRGDNSNEMGDNLPYVDVGGCCAIGARTSPYLRSTGQRKSQILRL